MCTVPAYLLQTYSSKLTSNSNGTLDKIQSHAGSIIAVKCELSKSSACTDDKHHAFQQVLFFLLFYFQASSREIREEYEALYLKRKKFEKSTPVFSYPLPWTPGKFMPCKRRKIVKILLKN
jgi:hypothetical protein